MAPSSALILIRGAFLDRNEVSLGCLVPNPLEPGQDCWPTKPPLIIAEEINKRSIKGLREYLGAGRHAGLRAKVTRIFSAKARMESHTIEELVAESATLYYLRQPSLYFDQLRDDDDTKEWIEKWWKLYPLFLVTGFLTITEAEVVRMRDRVADVLAGAEVAANDVASFGATTVLPNSADSAGVEFDVGSEGHSRYSFIAPGEHIIGVQYRKLKFKRFRCADLKNAKLEGNSWVMFRGQRGLKEPVGNIGDILVADLEESLTLDDLELEEEELLNHASVEDEEFVFLDE
jgi:hypothetical protein